MKTEAALAAARKELEEWRDQQIRCMNLVHDANLRELFHEARAHMEDAFERALDDYEENLAMLEEQRKAMRTRSPEAASQMENIWSRTAAYLRQGYDAQVELIKGAYQKLLGVT